MTDWKMLASVFIENIALVEGWLRKDGKPVPPRPQMNGTDLSVYVDALEAHHKKLKEIHFGEKSFKPAAATTAPKLTEIIPQGEKKAAVPSPSPAASLTPLTDKFKSLSGNFAEASKFYRENKGAMQAEQKAAEHAAFAAKYRDWNEKQKQK
jgi:hypothetical protein